MHELQPMWTNQRNLSEKETKKFVLLVFEYRLRGFDMEYFQCGAGSHIKQQSNNRCLIQ